MPGGFGPRFAIEAGFLILLAVGTGLAELRPALIIAVMAGAWLLVSLFEWTLWRAQTAPAAPRAVPVPQAEPEPGWALEEVEAQPEPEPEPELEPGGYPLRADLGLDLSEEVEAYTNVLGPGEGRAEPFQRPAEEASGDPLEPVAEEPEPPAAQVAGGNGGRSESAE